MARGRSKDLIRENLQLRKRIRQLEDSLSVKPPKEARLKQSKPQPVKSGCKECGSKIVISEVGKFTIWICEECGARGRFE